jgi:hypothetical protein
VISGTGSLTFLLLALSDLGMDRIRVPLAIFGAACLLIWFFNSGSIENRD